MAFDKIRYSLVWEDPQLLTSINDRTTRAETTSVETIRARTNHKALSIASAGDNSLTLLCDFQEVVAIDLSPAQIALVELKKASIENYEFDEHCELMGYKPSTRRQELYQGLEHHLKPSCKFFWQEHQKNILSGLALSGKLESYFLEFRRKVFKNFWSPENLERMCHTSDIQEQKHLWNHSNIEQVRLMATQFFSQSAMEGRARDSAQFLYVKKNNIGKNFTKKFEDLIQAQLISQNPFVYHFITGKFLLNSFDVPERSPDKYYQIKNNIYNLSIIEKDIESYLNDPQTSEFDFFNLSDIFEYMSEEQSEAAFKLLAKKASRSAQLAYWSLLVSRETYRNSWKKRKEKSQSLRQKDRLWLYSDFTVLEI